MRITEKPKVERIAWILLHLIRNRNRNFTAAQIHEWISKDEPVTLRNVQRDLKRLAEARGTCVQVQGKGKTKHYSIEQDMRDKLCLPIERNGLLALFVLKRIQPFFAQKAKTVQEMTRILQKMGESREDEIFEDLDQRLASRTHIAGERSLLAADGDLLDAVLTSLLDRKPLCFQYMAASSNEFSPYEMYPVKLVMWASQLYLVCLSDPRLIKGYYFKINRMQKASVVESKSFRISGQQLDKIDKWLGKSFGILDNPEAKPEKIVLKFPGWFGRTLSERVFHPSQRMTFDKEGNAVCTLEAPVGEELARWVLGWADLVTIQEPEELKEMVAEMARGLMKRNGGAA